MSFFTNSGYFSVNKYLNTSSYQLEENRIEISGGNRPKFDGSIEIRER